MTGFRIELDVDALARQSYRELPWWQRLVIRLLGKDRVITEATALLSNRQED